MPETYSAAEFAEILRVHGSNLRKLGAALPPPTDSRRADRTDEAAVVCRLGVARAVRSGELVGLALQLMSDPTGLFVPVSRTGDLWTVLTYWSPQSAAQLGQQLTRASAG